MALAIKYSALQVYAVILVYPFFNNWTRFSFQVKHPLIKLRTPGQLSAITNPVQIQLVPHHSLSITNLRWILLKFQAISTKIIY